MPEPTTPHTPELIHIRTDQGTVPLPVGSTVADALAKLVSDADRASRMATAVNGEFVPRQDRSTHPLQDGDALLLFGAITGG